MRKQVCNLGDVYGRWLILNFAEKPLHVKTRGRYYLCECQCQLKTQKIVAGRSLRRGESKSCGCIGFHVGKSEIGKVYGKWKVIDHAVKPYHRKGRGLYFLCECQCEDKTKRILSGCNLRQGITMSCGCVNKGIRNLDAPYNCLISYYKSSAKKRGLIFSLTLEDMKCITQQNCFYCGKSPAGKLKLMKNHDFHYNGIDRFDNKKDYIRDNCVPCCKICNTAKMCMTFEEFYQWINDIHDRLKFLSFQEKQNV